MKPTVGLSLWNVAAWRSDFEAASRPAAGSSSGSGERRQADHDDGGDDPPDSATGLAGPICIGLDRRKASWFVPGVEVQGAVLCADAAVAIVSDPQPAAVGAPKDAAPKRMTWRLAAYERASGKERWSVPLPGEPVFNGLAPSADGSWLLTMRDGAMVRVGPPKPR